MSIGLLSFERSLASTCAKCISSNNWSCTARPAFININSNEPFCYPFTFSFNKCGRRC